MSGWIAETISGQSKERQQEQMFSFFFGFFLNAKNRFNILEQMLNVCHEFSTE